MKYSEGSTESPGDWVEVPFGPFDDQGDVLAELTRICRQFVIRTDFEHYRNF